ncbi:MAG: AraC family transcriptional regulator ligand-binding domain-containing protein, partial [Desulfofustis sp.]
MLLTKLASIQHILWEILEEYGIDPDPVYWRVNLDPGLLFEPGARYPLSSISRLWLEMERLIEDPCFGLKTADYYHPSHFGTIGYAILASDSVRIGLERLIRYYRVVSDARFGELIDDPDNSLVHVKLNWNEEEPWSAAREDAALTFILSSCRLNFKKRLDPRRVEMTHNQYACLETYENYFNCRVKLECPAPLISFSRADADKPLRTGDEHLAQYHDRIMEDYISRLSSVRLMRSVQKVLVNQLPDGMVSVDAVARQLGMSTRKLQRELKHEGTTYQELL